MTEAPTQLDERMMARALTLARQAAEAGEAPIGAVVYETETGAVLAEAHNTREADADPTGHAEFTAIVQACRAVGDWRLNHCSLAVTLEPCPMCAGLIVNARVGRVVFGARDPKAGALRSLFRLGDDPRLNHRARIIEGVRGDACAAVLRTFFQGLRTARKDRRHP